MARAWTRTYTHQKARLDIRELQGGRNGRRNLLQPGTKIYSHRLNSGHSVSIRVRSDHVEVEYQVEDGGRCVPQSISVKLSFSQCKLGGTRAWWLCPCCSQRVAVLFGWGRFLCRKCADLNYLSQSETDSDRTLRRAGKLRKRLGWQPGIVNPRGGKPHGMHWQTYYQLWSRCHNEEVKALASFGASLAKLTGGGIGASTVSAKPAGPKSNPSSKKARVRTQYLDIAARSPPSSPWRSELTGLVSENAPSLVQCIDCVNLSVGFKCLAPGSGQSFPAMGDWRQCSEFVKFEVC